MLRHRQPTVVRPSPPFSAAIAVFPCSRRCPFALQKGSNRRLKGQLLQAQRAAFRKRKDSDGKTIGQRCFHHCKDIAFLSVMLGDDIIKVSPLFSFVFFNVSRRHCSAKSRRTCCPPCGKCVFLHRIDGEEARYDKNKRAGGSFGVHPAGRVGTAKLRPTDMAACTDRLAALPGRDNDDIH